MTNRPTRAEAAVTPVLPVSSRIRDRLKAARRRFHANDDIAAFIEPGELDALHAEVATKIAGVLESLVIDIESDHNTQDTAQVRLLVFEEISERRFANWSMDQVNIAKVNPSLLLKYSDKATLDPFACSGRATMALLDELVATAAITSHQS